MGLRDRQANDQSVQTLASVEVRIKNQSVFLDSDLIYRTEHRDLVRSKSERIIADKLHAAAIDY